VALDRCLFVCRIERAELRPLVEDRVALLADVLRPVGAFAVHRRWSPGAQAVWGAAAPAGGATAPLVFGEPVAGGFADTLPDADDVTLRSLLGSCAVVGGDGERVRVVTGPAGAAALYAARGRGIAAWATHALAAAVLATGRPRLAAERLPEYLAAGFVGADATLLDGVSAVPAGAVIDVDRRGAAAREYGSRAERWRPVESARAAAEARAALRETARARLLGRPATLALTAGLDSTVVAACLADLGLLADAYTWGEPGWPDVVGAQRTAEALGVGHVVQRARPLPDRPDELLAQAVWADGVGRLFPFWAPTWPAAAEVVVTGAGGEAGRAFYYALEVRNHRRPSTDDLLRVLALERRLGPEAAPSAVEAVAAAKRAWLQAAARDGVRGWRALDHVYVEQRVRHWGRSQLGPLRRPLVAAFATPDVVRALTSLPELDRASSAFHRRELRAAGLPAPGPLPLQRPGVPPPLRRLAARLRGGRHREPDAPWGWAGGWTDRPQLRAWYEREVVAWPVLREQFGDAWADALAAGFAADRHRATEHVLALAGPAALARHLATVAA